MKLKVLKKDLTEFEMQNKCISEQRLIDILFSNVIFTNQAIEKLQVDYEVERLTPSNDDLYEEFFQYAIVTDSEYVDFYELWADLPFNLFYISALDLTYIAFSDLGSSREIVHGLDWDFVEFI